MAKERQKGHNWRLRKKFSENLGLCLNEVPEVSRYGKMTEGKLEKNWEFIFTF